MSRKNISRNPTAITLDQKMIYMNVYSTSYGRDFVHMELRVILR